MRLVVQILPADRTEPGAVWTAEDLVRQGKRKRVAGPTREVELVVGHVRRSELLRAARVRRLVLVRIDRKLERRVAEATEAGAVEPPRELKLEDQARARTRDLEPGGDALRHGEVTLAGELERLQFELDLVAILLPRPELDRSEVEAPYGVSVAGRARTRAPAGRGRARTIRITATTIAAPAASVVPVIASPRKRAPSAAATTGFT